MKRLIVVALERTCGFVDGLPVLRRSTEGKLRVEPCLWGCWHLRLATLSAELDERWQTGEWR